MGGFLDGLLSWLGKPAASSPSVMAPVRDPLVAFLEAWEGRSLTPYRDVAGYWTVGVGHLLTAGEELRPRTSAEVDQLLAQDLAHARADVRACAMHSKLLPQHIDAMTSFVFNLGSKALRDSTLLRRVNLGDFDGAAEEFKRWNKARDPKSGLLVEVPGLSKRRSAERAMFLLGDYSGRP